MHPFELLGEPVRRRIVEILASGEHTAGEIADTVRAEFGISASAVSKHLRILRETDFVIVHYEGQSRVYRLHSEALDRLDSVVGDLFELWDRRIGWRYDTDPLTNPPRRLSRRGLRGVDMRDDPWVMAARAERRPRTAVLDALTTHAGPLATEPWRATAAVCDCPAGVRLGRARTGGAGILAHTMDDPPPAHRSLTSERDGYRAL